MTGVELSLAVVTGLWPLQAMALDPVACEFQTVNGEDSAWAGPVTDMGQGIVMQADGNASFWSSGSEVKFTHCATGQTLASMSLNITEHDNWTSPVNTYEVMRDAIAATGSFTFTDLETQIRAAGGNALVYMADTEACGCAAFYPELRGAQVGWRAE
jgi:hypothetical protein